VKDLVATVDAGLFWGLVAGFLLGVVATWRLARVFERFRDAVWQAKSHFQKWLDFTRYASEHMTLLVSTGAIAAAFTGAVGFLVYLRVTG
jgi:hypothetical protein